jgi:hypothetical protein
MLASFEVNAVIAHLSFFYSVKVHFLFNAHSSRLLNSPGYSRDTTRTVEHLPQHIRYSTLCFPRLACSTISLHLHFGQLFIYVIGLLFKLKKVFSKNYLFLVFLFLSYMKVFRNALLLLNIPFHKIQKVDSLLLL